MATGFENLTDNFNKRLEEIGRLLNHKIQNPEKYKQFGLKIADCGLPTTKVQSIRKSTITKHKH